MGKVGRSQWDRACNNELDGYKLEFGVPEWEAECFSHLSVMRGKIILFHLGLEGNHLFLCLLFNHCHTTYLSVHSTSIYYMLSIVLATLYTFFHSTFPEAL